MEFSISYNMVRKHVFENVILEQSPKGSEGWNHVAVWGKSIPGRRRARTETMRQEHPWGARGTAWRPKAGRSRNQEGWSGRG